MIKDHIIPTGVGPLVGHFIGDFALSQVCKPCQEDRCTYESGSHMAGIGFNFPDQVIQHQLPFIIRGKIKV